MYSNGRNKSLDGIRGIAILMVLVWHYFNILIIPQAHTFLGYLHLSTKLFWSGVDLFFVLSGYLIGGILLRSRHGSSHQYYKRFYLRRFFRIIPIYTLLLLLVYFYSCFKLGFNSTNETLSEWLPYLFFIQNYTHESIQYAGLLGATWSLAVEEQFYLFLPFILRLNKKLFLSIIIILILISPVIRYFTQNYSWFITRGDSLLLGVLIAYAVQFKKVTLWIKLNQHTILFFMMILLGSLAYFSIHKPYPGHFLNHLFLSLFYGGLIALAAHGNLVYLKTFLENKLLIWFGHRSYSIYLMHWLILAILAETVLGHSDWKFLLMEEHGSRLVFAALLISLCVCDFLYRFVEKPMIAIGHQLTTFPEQVSNMNKQPI